MNNTLFKKIKRANSKYAEYLSACDKVALEKAKVGHPVCTRDGKEARILCFDRIGHYPIVALVKEAGDETIFSYNKKGRFSNDGRKCMCDLFMKAVKREAWIQEEKERQSLKEQTRQLAEENKNLENQIEEDLPKVIFAMAVTESKRSCLVAELAKIICQNGMEVGQNRLFKWLRKRGYLGVKGEYYNQPMQRWVEAEMFEIKKRTITKPNGDLITVSTPLVTGKGQVYLVNKFLKEYVSK